MSPSKAFPGLLKYICRSQHLIELSKQMQKEEKDSLQNFTPNIVLQVPSSSPILFSAQQEP